MTIAALIERGGLQRLANANPAKAANDGLLPSGTLATLATLAVATIPALETDSAREWYRERAAIMEFDGGLSREEAERQAWARTRARYRLH